jgi:DNA polymerase-1
MEHRGVKIDLDWVEAQHQLYLDETYAIEEEMKTLPEVKKLVSRYKAHKGFGGFIPTSSKQIGEILFDILKLKPSKKTPGGKPSTDASSLELLKGKAKFVDLLLNHREIEVLQNNYLIKFPLMVDVKGLIHGNFSPAFQVTGRISVSNPPVANMPREPRVRGMVVSRFAGGNILSCDYKQLEMRLVASEANEENMLKVFKEGKDVHDETARTMFGERFTKDDRSISKNINFGTVYGISSFSLSQKFSISKEKSEEFIEKHRKAYPKIYAWMGQQHSFIKKNGWVSNRFGRVRHLPEILRLEEGDREEWMLIQRILRQTGNFPIQAQGSDITSMASIRVNELIKSRGLKSLLVLQPHDALLIDCYPGEEMKVAAICCKVMEKEVPSQCPWLRVQLPVDVKISKRWGGLDD